MLVEQFYGKLIKWFVSWAIVLFGNILYLVLFKNDSAKSVQIYMKGIIMLKKKYILW